MCVCLVFYSFKKRCALEFNGKDGKDAATRRKLADADSPSDANTGQTPATSQPFILGPCDSNNNNHISSSNDNCQQIFSQLCEQDFELKIRKEMMGDMQDLNDTVAFDTFDSVPLNQQHLLEQFTASATDVINTTEPQLPTVTYTGIDGGHGQTMADPLNFELPTTTSWVMDYDSGQNTPLVAHDNSVGGSDQGPIGSDVSPLSSASCELFEISAQQLINTDDVEAAQIASRAVCVADIDLDSCSPDTGSAKGHTTRRRRCSPESDTDDDENTLKVPHISKVRDALDTLERFSLTRAPELLSTVLQMRQDVGNFVIERQRLRASRR